ncbi:MAG: hypothetical protein R6X32_15270, partial [Chloroflexota bacterium]
MNLHPFGAAQGKLWCAHAHVVSSVNVTQVVNLEKQQVGNLCYVFIPGHAGHLLVRRGACGLLTKLCVDRG